MTNQRTESPHDDPAGDEPEDVDPRMKEPGRRGMPVETIDTVHNMPGQQEKPPQTDS